jgi:hypothetical protein
MEQLSLNLRLLEFSGIVEPPIVHGSFWKKFLFSLYMATSILVFTPILFGELLALYHFWGDLVVITNNVFTLVGNVTFYGEALYIIIRRRKFLMLMKKLQDMLEQIHRLLTQTLKTDHETSQIDRTSQRERMSEAQS